MKFQAAMLGSLIDKKIMGFPDDPVASESTLQCMGHQFDP